MNNNKLIWYLCYGSNLSYERFMRYINKCSDKTPPVESRSIIIHNKLYFAGQSTIWHNKATAYIEVKQDPNMQTYARLYKITEEQYLEVKCQEGSKYEREIKFPDVDGLRCVSFTETIGCNLIRHNNIDPEYLKTILTGLMEIGITETEAKQYIHQIINNH